MINLVLGKSTLATVTFRLFNDDTDTGSPADPVTITGDVKDVNGNVILTFSPTRQDVGVYSYVWTPVSDGIFTLEFIGTYADSSQDIIQEEFQITPSAQNSVLFNKLGEDQYLQFMPPLDDVYVDPEEISLVFPDASPIDVIALIHTYSQEVEEIQGPQSDDREPLPLNTNPERESDVSNWTTVCFEYIKAATLCALSKLYGFGDADLTQITLGDLEVTNQRFGRTVINRLNAVTWCEMAGALREEMVADSGRQTFKAIMKGSRFGNPIPRRHLRQYEHGR